MGYIDELDVVAGLAALEMVLDELGHDVEPGCAVTAAQQVLLGQKSVAAVLTERSESARTVRARLDPDRSVSD